MEKYIGKRVDPITETNKIQTIRFDTNVEANKRIGNSQKKPKTLYFCEHCNSGISDWSDAAGYENSRIKITNGTMMLPKAIAKAGEHTMCLDGMYCNLECLYNRLNNRLKRTTAQEDIVGYIPMDEKEKLFMDIWNPLQMKTHAKYPQSMFYLTNNQVYFEQDTRTEFFWCDNTLVWSKFKELGMAKEYIIVFIAKMLRETLKVETYIPSAGHMHRTSPADRNTVIHGFLPNSTANTKKTQTWKKLTW